MNRFMHNLKYFRKADKMTQKELAAKLNISTNNIGHWEKGRTEPDIETLLRLCEIFSVSLDDLLR